MMKKTYNHILVWGVIFYSICIVCFCFTPQEQSTVGVGTPGIQHLGRLVFLLTPLIFQLLYLFPNLRKTKKVLLFSFLVSLGIECTQLILDFFFDFNRVFEIDDLWTNTLGGYLAWLLYKRLHKNKIRN
ncbi:VanZ family protein [Streptococcus pneumoniae]|uniref:VanZ family protein n=1 Tax=Streptococcus pneumoniae TaxID=1313 RepID=UPI001CCF6BCF|nr:VanZ family protein [Streptococcus pneumoniae]MBZ8030350.1 VanZ family protein [Streptococcus pneumoniae]